MKIISAQFIKGVVGEEALLYDGTPQIAFIGRSNVGKSSTLNSILERRKLVKVGKTPGKTREINFFDVVLDTKDHIYFVDLPGYGYAKISKSERSTLAERIKWYITHPQADTALICLIIDAKVGLTDFDKGALDLIKKHKKQYFIGVNKIDRINQKTQNELLKDLKEYLQEDFEKVTLYSAQKNKGVHKILQRIEATLYQ